MDKNKKSALHLFARGHVDVVKVLILNGANTKQKDVDGLTFDLAIHYKDLEIATLLIQSVADDKVHTAACAVLAIAADNDYRWRQHYGVFCTLKLVCFGAMKAAGIMSYAEIIKYDRTNLLGKIKDRLDSLRAGNRMRKLFNVSRGETIHVEPRIFLHYKTSRGCLQSILRDSLIHHISRYFHGIWIRPW